MPQFPKNYLLDTNMLTVLASGHTLDILTTPQGEKS